MQLTKQQGHLHFFNKRKLSERYNSQSGPEASRLPVLQIYNIFQRVRAGMLRVAGWTKKQKGEFVTQHDKNTWHLAFM